MKRLLLFLACALMSGLPISADILSGRLLDPQGAAVGGAEVMLYDRNSGNTRKTISDEKGQFRFVEIGSGPYIFRAQTPGSALTASEEIVVSGETAKDVTLSLSN